MCYRVASPLAAQHYAQRHRGLPHVPDPFPSFPPIGAPHGAPPLPPPPLQFNIMLDVIEDYLIYRGYKYRRLDGSTNRIQRMIDIEVRGQRGGGWGDGRRGMEGGGGVPLVGWTAVQTASSA